jgi:hypothetical protein
MAYECFTLSQGEVPANFTNANYAALQACYSTLIPAQPACNTQFTACLANSACAFGVNSNFACVDKIWSDNVVMANATSYTTSMNACLTAPSVVVPDNNQNWTN